MSDDRYVFKLYTTAIPTANTKRMLGSGYKGDDSFFLDSPYVDTQGIDKSNPDSWHNIGDTLHSNDLGTLSRDFTARPSVYGHKLKQDENSEEYIELPHRGISVIGLSDPRYSMYRPNDILDTMLHNKNGVITINERLLSALPEAWEYDLYNYLDSNEYDINKAPSGSEENYNRGNRLFNNWKRTKGYAMLTPRENFYGGSSDYDFGYKPSYYKLLQAIADTHLGSGTEGNGLVLASIPESALYNVSNVASGKMRGQRDFPEELIVNQLKLNNLIGINDAPPNREDYASEAEYKEAVKNHEALKIFDDDYDNVADMQGTSFGSKLNDWLETTKNKPHNMRENLARDLIFSYFDIDPDKIISDETKKIIFDDLSNWYKGYYDKKKTEYNNIISGIKELGQ